jgi:hypothetical protein
VSAAPRLVRVRVTLPSYTALQSLAARRWRSPEGLAADVIAKHLDRVRIPSGRQRMPVGIDLTVHVSEALWSIARVVANEEDMTIGQLFRHVLERYLAAESPSCAASAEHTHRAS